MKIKTLIFVLVICFMACLVANAQNEKVSVDFKNMAASAALDNLFKGYDKNVSISPNTPNNYVTLKMTNQPFDTVLGAILKQINATFEYKDGVYYIGPDMNSYNNQMPGRNGMPAGPNGTVMPGMQPNTGMPGQPNLGGPQGAGVGQGMGPGMAGQGNQRGGFGSGQGTTKPTAYNDPIIKISVKYNSPYQVLSLMEGDDYADVVYYGSGSSGSSNGNGNNNNNSNNNNNNNSSRSSRSSNR